MNRPFLSDIEPDEDETGFVAVDKETLLRAAARVLTEKQFRAYILYAQGLSEGRISIELRISRRAVRDRLHHADVKISNALKTKEAA